MHLKTTNQWSRIQLVFAGYFYALIDFRRLSQAYI